MIKKISVAQLTPGMFVHDFNAAWLDGVTLPGQTMIMSDDEVENIVGLGLKELFIDTDMGLDVEDAPTWEEVDSQLHDQLRELGKEGSMTQRLAAIKPVSYDQEVGRAAEVKAQARQLAESVMQDARMGRPVTLQPVRDTVNQMVESVFRNQDALLSLGLIKKKDNYTFMHSVNVGVFLLSFARMLELEADDIVSVGIGAILHDMGKMKVPQDVLNKPGKLSDSEFGVMKGHVSRGEEILNNTPGIPPIAVTVASQHHERFDGSGYPRGLKGDGITLFGQMAAIVDVYDAITSDRVYHKGMPPHEALRKMFDWSAHHFNRELFQSFVRCVGIYPVGSLVKLRGGLVGVVLRTNRESLLHPVLMVVGDKRKGIKVRPTEVDLMQHQGKEGFQIEGSEPADKWGINPMMFLPEAQMLTSS